MRQIVVASFSWSAKEVVAEFSGTAILLRSNIRRDIDAGPASPALEGGGSGTNAEDEGATDAFGNTAYGKNMYATVTLGKDDASAGAKGAVEPTPSTKQAI